MDDLSNSIEDFSKACELRKDDPFPYYHLGMNHLISGNYDAGLEKLSLAIELNKYEPQFHNYKGLALYLSG